MVRTVRIAPGPIDQETVALLKRATVLLCLDNYLVRRLASEGFAAELAGDEIPDGAMLIVGDRPLDGLARICDRLLGPGGCPWDQKQTHESLKKYLLEEAYEVIDAIDSGSMEDLREELGDLLLQPFLHAQIRQYRTGEFNIDDVAQGINEKLIRRHPHVYGEESAETPEEVLVNWQRIKQGEKGTGSAEPQSMLAGVPRSMPSLLRAHEISKRAAKVGFEWPDLEGVFDKVAEESLELREAIESGVLERIEAELGDLLFTLVNIGRWTGAEPEEALRRMLDRFSARFMAMEAATSKPLPELSADEWEALWQTAKTQVG